MIKITRDAYAQLSETQQKALGSTGYGAFGLEPTVELTDCDHPDAIKEITLSLRVKLLEKVVTNQNRSIEMLMDFRKEANSEKERVRMERLLAKPAIDKPLPVDTPYPLAILSCVAMSAAALLFSVYTLASSSL